MEKVNGLLYQGIHIMKVSFTESLNTKCIPLHYFRICRQQFPL